MSTKSLPKAALLRNIMKAEEERLTSGEEGADHEAEGDGGDGEDCQEGEHQGGVTVGEHCPLLTHLQIKFMASSYLLHMQCAPMTQWS